MPTILVIDDTPELLELLGIILAKAGYRVLTASGGEDGIPLALQELPDLIIVDIELEGMDGISVLKALRTDPRLASRPIVALTAYAMTHDRDRLLAAGFTGYLSKPVRPWKLLTQIAEFLSGSQQPGS
jgi:CheY-like chemotaxis protein